MILIDLSASAIASFSMYAKTNKIGSNSGLYKTSGLETGITTNYDEKTDTELLREMLLKALVSYRKEYRNDFGTLVLCCDSSTYWRRSVFPLYKAGRKKARENSAFNWATFHQIFEGLKQEFKTHLPYKLIEVAGAEADDVIAALCIHNHFNAEPEKVLIYSADHDFLQLQRYPEVQQWDQRLKRWLRVDNVEHTLQEKIIRGDPGDGIPNILSPDNSFVTGTRQKSLMTAKVDVWKTQHPDDFCETEDMKIRFDRNRQLINFSFIPISVFEDIIDQYKASQPNLKRSKLEAYIVDSNARDLFTSIGDF